MFFNELVKEYRRCTRLIVYLEFFFAIFMLFVTSLSILALGALVGDPEMMLKHGKLTKIPDFCLDNCIAFQCLVVVLLSLETGFQFKAAASLLEATKPRITIPYALQCIRFWRNVTAFLCLQHLILLILASQWTFAALLFILRLFIHCEVEGFNQTFLAKAASMGPHGASSQTGNMQRNLHSVVVHTFRTK